MRIGNYSAKYISEFVILNCAPELLAMKLFPNSKEITESFAMFAAARKYIFPHIKPHRENIDLFVIGDGHMPRTAALFAFLTKWRCHSIDPLFKNKFMSQLDVKRKAINRLKLYKNKIEKLSFDVKNSIVIMPHSHATIKNVCKSINADNFYLINMPCCIHETPDYLPEIEYVDRGVWSPRNIIQYWNYKPYA